MKVQATADVWIIGDKFLRSMYAELQSLCSEAAIKKRPPPYLYEFYNVFCYYPTTKMNALAGIINAYIEILNNRSHLPKYVIVIPDKNIIEAADHCDFGVKKGLRNLIKWIMVQLHRYTESRREDLRDKKPGAVGPKPRFIWVKMIDWQMLEHHPDRSYTDVLGLRTKFNRTMENLLAESTVSNCSHIMQLAYLSKSNHFTNLGELNFEGKRHFWKEIDYNFKKFDRGEIDLKPEYAPDTNRK